MRASLISLTTVLALSLTQALAAAPNFTDYPAAPETAKKPPRLKLTDAESRRYVTQLREASRQAPDFAGHYILANWGCGAGCVMAAAIDTHSGSVHMLPFTVSDWPLEVTEPLSYRPESRLLIVRGSRNEKGKGTYYYEFDGRSFKLLADEQDKSASHS